MSYHRAELTAASWPIAAATLPFAPAQDAAAGHWRDALRKLVDEGFTEVDITDSWLRPGDLAEARLQELRDVLDDVGIAAVGISAIRRSVIDPEGADDNLAYSHRTIDAAAALGAGIVSFGLHRALMPAQQDALWFWTVPGARDPEGDRDAWQLAVARFRELGRHAVGAGVQVSLEMYEDTYLGTADSAVRLLEDIDHPAVGLNPDLGNLIRVQAPIEPWESMAEKTLPLANYWHVKNYLRFEDPHSGAVFTTPASLELGVINYRSAVRFAVDHGFRGPICVEHYGGDSLGVSAVNRDYLRRILPARVPAVA